VRNPRSGSLPALRNHIRFLAKAQIDDASVAAVIAALQRQEIITVPASASSLRRVRPSHPRRRTMEPPTPRETTVRETARATPDSHDAPEGRGMRRGHGAGGIDAVGAVAWNVNACASDEANHRDAPDSSPVWGRWRGGLLDDICRRRPGAPSKFPTRTRRRQR